ncbi:hypothetical protein T10_5118, partial [Trichinella papuae]
LLSGGKCYLLSVALIRGGGGDFGGRPLPLIGKSFMQISLMRKACFTDNKPNISQISTVDGIIRYRYCPNEAVIYAYSFSQKNASQHCNECVRNHTAFGCRFNFAIWSHWLKIQKSHCLSLNIAKSFEVQAIRNCFGVIREVGVFFIWFFKRSTALKTFIEKLKVRLRTKNKATLTWSVKRDELNNMMQRLCSILLSGKTAEQLRFAVCQGSFVISL